MAEQEDQEMSTWPEGHWMWASPALFIYTDAG